MRYLSLVFIIFLMWWSWSVAKAPNLIPEDIHVGIQEDLKRVITDYIKDNLPDVSEVKFQKFWTETLRENKVKATFSYTFEQDSKDKPAASIGIAGYAILNHSKEQNSTYDIWSLDELNVENNHIVFKDGSSIKAHGGDQEEK
jgi:hypothetical protein